MRFYGLALVAIRPCFAQGLQSFLINPEEYAIVQQSVPLLHGRLTLKASEQHRVMQRLLIPNCGGAMGGVSDGHAFGSSSRLDTVPLITANLTEGLE